MSLLFIHDIAHVIDVLVKSNDRFSSFVVFYAIQRKQLSSQAGSNVRKKLPTLAKKQKPVVRKKRTQKLTTEMVTILLFNPIDV